MSNQGRIRPKYLWRLPLAGAILTLIGFLTPLTYVTDYSGSMYMWIWKIKVKLLILFGLLTIYKSKFH